MRSSAARVGSLPYVSPDRLEVNVLEGDVNIINEIEDPWRALCRECADDEPFYTPEWIAAHVRAFSPGATLSIVIATLDGQFLFILPLIKKWHTFQGVPVRTLSSPTNSHSCRFDAVRRLGTEGDSAVRAAWNHLRSRSDWDLLSLRETPDGGTVAALVDAAESDDLHTAGIAMRSNPLIRIPKDAESLQRLPTNSRLRGKLRHVRRELEQRGTLRLRRVSRPRREEMDKFYELEASGWKGEERSAILAKTSTRQFYTEITKNAGQLNYLSMYFLELDDQLLAAHLGLSYRRTYYSPKLAYNEAFKEFAPGHLIISEILKDLATRGIDTYDITGPDDEWKMRWTNEVRPRFQQLIFNKGILGQMAHSVGLRMKPWAKRVIFKRGPKK